MSKQKNARPARLAHGLWATLAAGLVTACGGGGGDSAAPAAPAAPATGSIGIAGTAAKGLMANADVNVYAVNADGTVGATSLGSATTNGKADANPGQYTLTFNGTTGQRYVVRVTAKPAGGTEHLNEATSPPSWQAVPVAFAMRSVVTPATTGTVSTSVSITPFSEMAVAAAAKASGGLSAANVTQAKATVQTLLGFDPIAVDVKPIATATTPEQKQLAVLLGSVAELAAAGSLGCAAGAIDCVVNTLASAATVSSLKLTAGSTDVSAALAGALTTALAKPEVVAAKVDAAQLSVATASLACTTACAAPVAVAVDGSTASAIAAATSLFNNLRSDWLALFSGGGATAGATGAVNQQAFAFRTAATGAQSSADVLLRDLNTLILAADLYADYKAGRTTNPNRSKGSGLTSVSGVNPDLVSAVGCTLYQTLDSSGTLPITIATAPANANYIGCRASYFRRVTVSGGVTTSTDWRHGFTITPSASGTAFSYASGARRNTTVGGTTTENVALQASGYNGTFDVTTAAGAITGFTWAGTLPGAFAPNGTTLVNGSHAVNLTGTRTVASGGVETHTVAGTLTARKTDGSTDNTLEVKPTTTTSAPAAEGGEVATGTLDVVWTGATARFAGKLEATESKWDKSLSSATPTKVSASGSFATLAGTTVNEFLNGSLTVTLTGYENWDARLPDSATNTFTTAVAFTGKVTAPSRPLLELTLATSQRVEQTTLGTVNLQYRSFAAGSTTPGRVVAITGTQQPGAANASWTLTEAASDLSLAWDGAANTVPLRKGGTTIGSLNRGSGVLTFSDNTFVSLDLGF